jgi:hypothetical protein
MDEDVNPQETNKRRRAKNLALGAILSSLVILFYFITMVKFQILIFEF